MAIDNKASKNEDFTKLKRSDLSMQIHVMHEGVNEKCMLSELQPTRNMRRLTLLLAVSIGNFLAAQDVLVVPAWMRKTLGTARAASTKFYGYDTDHDRWQREVKRPHAFIGSYAFEVMRIKGEGTVDTLRYRVEGWQDSTRSITTLTFPTLDASFTYLADLKTDVAIIAERVKDERRLKAERISHLVDHRGKGMLVEMLYEMPIFPDSATGRKESVLGVPCEERVPTLSGQGSSYWVAPALPSPFHEAGRWMPVSEGLFGDFVELSCIGERMPMKRMDAKSRMEMVQMKRGLQPRPAPDLSRYTINEPPPYVPDPNLKDELIAVDVVQEGSEPLPPSEGVSDQNEDQVCEMAAVQEQPQFPGGEAAMLEFIHSNIRYPETEKANGVQGKVFVEFVIGKDGAVGQITTKRGVAGGPGLTREAERVVKTMPKWTPGNMNGKPVAVRLSIPILFKLDD